MGITVAIVAQGGMGSGVGKRLNERGAVVRTLLSGRSGKSAERARAAGMQPAANEKALLDSADVFLSILPPDQAENLARQLAPAMTALAKKPGYVACNAVSPQTVERSAARFGCGEALIAELSKSQPDMLKRMRGSLPGMYDKAYRWVGEMEEISDFLQANKPSADMYAAIARLYEFLAAAEAEKSPGP